MKNLFIVAVALLLASTQCYATYVNGYMRSNGTYVAPHYRSSADSSRYNNYSSKGNYNPYTGQKGYKNPYSIPSYSNNSYNSRQRNYYRY